MRAALVATGEPAAAGVAGTVSADIENKVATVTTRQARSGRMQFWVSLTSVEMMA
jgi:hypothetical protein